MTMSTTIHEICEHFDRFVGPLGWTTKRLTERDGYSFEVEVEFADCDPRRWILVSDDRFATLDKVKVYEVLVKPKSAEERVRDAREKLDRMMQLERMGAVTSGEVLDCINGIRKSEGLPPLPAPPETSK
jgi:hypothetical protein